MAAQRGQRRCSGPGVVPLAANSLETLHLRRARVLERFNCLVSYVPLGTDAPHGEIPVHGVFWLRSVTRTKINHPIDSEIGVLAIHVLRKLNLDAVLKVVRVAPLRLDAEDTESSRCKGSGNAEIHPPAT